jgi:dihydroorotase
MKTLIQGATCVFPDETRQADVLIEGTKIVAIDPPAGTDADPVDAAGLYLIPGVIDDHVHFRDPGLTDKEDLTTGSHACAKGGVTTFLEMPNTIPNAVDQPRIDEKLALAAEKSVVNYGFYIGATGKNTHSLRDAERVAGIKIFIGSSEGDLLVDDQVELDQIFEQTTLPICAHCEDETTVRRNKARLEHRGRGNTWADHSEIRDHMSAIIATVRAIELAKHYQHRFHVLHVSTADELPLIADHGGLITAEVCLHHLLFNVDDYARLEWQVLMNPSIKTAADNEALWNGLLDGTVQVVATDHAPHTLPEKKRSYPMSNSGLPAVENSLALMLHRVNQGLCSIEQVVSWMCDAPARVWDIVDKGCIAVGYDADLVLVDLNREETILNENQLTKSGWSPWHGTTLKGWPIQTWVMGQTVFENGEVNKSVSGSEAKYDHSRGGYWNTQA